MIHATSVAQVLLNLFVKEQAEHSENDRSGPNKRLLKGDSIEPSIQNKSVRARERKPPEKVIAQCLPSCFVKYSLLCELQTLTEFDALSTGNQSLFSVKTDESQYVKGEYMCNKTIYYPVISTDDAIHALKGFSKTSCFYDQSCLNTLRILEVFLFSTDYDQNEMIYCYIIELDSCLESRSVLLETSQCIPKSNVFLLYIH